MVECWIRASFPASSCDVCEQSLGCLVKIVVLFWESDTKLQHNSLQKEWPYPSRATYLQLCRLRLFFLSRTETSWEVCSQKEKMEQKGVSTLPLQPQISSLCSHFDIHVKATWFGYLQQQTSHLRTVYYPCLGSIVLYSLSSAHDLKGVKVCPMWTRMGFLSL